MIQVAPAIKRVVDQLLNLKLITRTQSTSDRRLSAIRLTFVVANLLESMDSCVKAREGRFVAHPPGREYPPGRSRGRS